ncbi:MAG: hypothetical protein AAF585_20950 [Verrucomicrobiota bacterium]
MNDVAEPQKFEYSVGPLNHTAEIHPTHFSAKLGLRKISIPFEQIQHIFVQKLESSNMEELIISQQLMAGKRKVHRLPAMAGDARFTALVDALIARKPDADIRDMDPVDARRLMGGRNVHKITLMVLVPVVTLIVAMFGLPAFVRGFDNGHATVGAAHFIAGDLPETRNLTLENSLPVMDAGVELTTTRSSDSGTSTTVEYFIPAIDPNGSDQQAVHLVIKCAKSELDELETAGTGPFSGLIRNALWQGKLPDDVRTYMEIDLQLPVAKTVYIFDYKGSAKVELYTWTAIVGGVFLLMAMISFWVYRKGFANKA